MDTLLIIIMIIACMSSSIQCYSSLVAASSSLPDSTSSSLDNQTTSGKQSTMFFDASIMAMTNPTGPAGPVTTTNTGQETHGHQDHQFSSNTTNATGSEAILNNTTSDYGRNLTGHDKQQNLCHCWQTSQEDTDLLEHDECQCEGPLIVRISQVLSSNLQRLTITSAAIPRLRKMGLKKYKLIQDVTMSDLPAFSEIEAGAFANLTHLRTIYITQAPKLLTLGAEVFLDISKSFKSLRVINSGLIVVPDLRHLASQGILNMVDLEGNRITNLITDSFNIKTVQLNLDNNELVSIDSYAFRGSEIAKLSLKGNSNLVTIHKQAFAGVKNILELDLSNTAVGKIPHEGLHTLERLRIQNTHSLKVIPSLLNFRDLQEAFLTHSFHCCAFKYPARHDPKYFAERQRQMMIIQKQCAESSSTKSTMHPAAAVAQDSDSWGHPVETWGDVIESWGKPVETAGQDKKALRRRRLANDLNLSKNTPIISIEEISSSSQVDDGIVPVTGTVDDEEIAEHVNEEWKNDQEVNYDEGEVEDSEEGSFHDDSSNGVSIDVLCNAFTEDRPPIRCYPIPDALNPCEDVMGSNYLRGSVWIVAFLAVFGNVLVLVVLLTTRSELTVFKFLMCNLAFADLCMGLYLLLLACIDLHSIGEYFNFAFDWQYGAGCKAAGFLTNFASHLSVFTLTVITLERWFAITNAIYLNKRLSLSSSVKIMIGGWIYSVIMACLPLLGMSNYSSTSICLPMEARDWVDVSYLVSLILTNGIAFLVIVVCYVLIYYSLGKETRRAEMKIAQKMALLVFTNFVCWAPIAFFASTALAGYPLIDVAKSKILLVFFYPLNSCANPYLYAITQYRRDLFQLLSKFGLCTERARKYKMSISGTTNIPLIERMAKTDATENGTANGTRKISNEAYL